MSLSDTQVLTAMVIALFPAVMAAMLGAALADT
jgi:photosystem I reaction center subunit XII